MKMDSLETNETTAIEQSSEQIETILNPVNEGAEDATQTQPQTKEDVVAMAKDMIASQEPIDKQKADMLKAVFYKIHNNEMMQERDKFVEAGGEIEKFVPKLDALEPEFRALMQIIRDRRATELEEAERQKQQNLDAKLRILERIQQLAATPEEANQHFDEFKALQAEWKEIKAVPAERATELWKNYQLYVEQFYDLLKLGHELRDYDFRKNLEIKTKLCEQAEALTTEEDVVAAINQLQNLHQEWKETGPVAKDLRDEIWNRFKEASTVVRKRHQAHFEAQKAMQEENLAKKEALCEQIENVDMDALKTFADWDRVTKEIIDIQASWKAIGYATQKMNTIVFERFRMACDRFFERKAQFFRQIKDIQNENLAKKKALVERAEALASSTEWKTATDAFVEMQKQWKEIGAVPRKFADSLWKRFIQACDTFFEEKKKALSSASQEQKANLEQKKSLIVQLQELVDGGENNQLIAKAKEIQKQWNAIGHVPFHEKDKIYEAFSSLMDKIYKNQNESMARRRLKNFKNSLAAKVDEGTSAISIERAKMMRAYENLKTEIQTYENNLGFLSASSKKGNTLVDTMRKKVDKLRDELNLLAEKIRAVDETINNSKQ